MEKTEYEMITRYKIFELREGLLKELKEGHYTGYSNVFSDYDTREESERDIMKKIDSCCKYIILPITEKSIKWDE